MNTSSITEIQEIIKLSKLLHFSGFVQKFTVFMAKRKKKHHPHVYYPLLFSYIKEYISL